MTTLAAQHDASGDAGPAQANASGRVEFRVSPAGYRHWRISVEGPVATLVMDVDEQGGLVPGYELKLNSYDLGVDIELADAVQRLLRREPAERRRLATRHPAYTSALTPGGVSVYVRSALAKESGTQREEGRAWFRRQRCRVLPGW